MPHPLAAVVDDVVSRLFPGRAFTVEPLEGGITNANFKVVLGAGGESGSEQVVVRIPGKDTELLGIDRRIEVAANRLAAAAGVAPELIAVDEVSDSIVTRFIQGRPVPMAELGSEPMLGDVLATLHRVHRAGAVGAAFDHFSVIRSYHERAHRRGVTEPFDYAAAEDVLTSIEQVRRFRPTVLGHNDLLNANFLYDRSPRILDWEYAGMADPFFDLANLSVNNELGPASDETVLSHYFGSVDDASLATLRLMKLVSELREAMWGVVQAAISDLVVDFVAYAHERARRFSALLDDVDLGSLLRQAALRG